MTIKPLTIGELAQLYNVDRRTLKNWLYRLDPDNKLGILHPILGRYYSPAQVTVIFNKLTAPYDD